MPKTGLPKLTPSDCRKLSLAANDVGLGQEAGHPILEALLLLNRYSTLLAVAKWTRGDVDGLTGCLVCSVHNGVQRKLLAVTSVRYGIRPVAEHGSLNSTAATARLPPPPNSPTSEEVLCKERHHSHLLQL